LTKKEVKKIVKREIAENIEDKYYETYYIGGTTDNFNYSGFVGGESNLIPVLQGAGEQNRDGLRIKPTKMELMLDIKAGTTSPATLYDKMLRFIIYQYMDSDQTSAPSCQELIPGNTISTGYGTVGVCSTLVEPEQKQRYHVVYDSGPVPFDFNLNKHWNKKINLRKRKFVLYDQNNSGTGTSKYFCNMFINFTSVTPSDLPQCTGDIRVYYEDA
jgi:hypothetical protein